MADNLLNRGGGEVAPIRIAYDAASVSPAKVEPAPPESHSDEPEAATSFAAEAKAVWPLALGTIATLVWFAAWAVYLLRRAAPFNLAEIALPELAVLVVAVLVPPATAWALASYIERGRRLNRRNEALAEHLVRLEIPAERAEERVRTITRGRAVQR